MALMTANTIARPYAKALFAAAGDASDTIDQGLARLAATSQLPEVANILNHPQLNAQRAVELFSVVITESPQAALLQRLLVLLADNRRLAVLPKIAQQFQAHCDAEQRRIRGHATAAFELDQATLTLLNDKVKQLTQQDDVVLTTAVDPNLIGGVVLTLGDTVIDNSVRGKLRRLRQNLLA